MPRGRPAPTLDELSPMLLVERKAIPREAGWLYEIKFDSFHPFGRCAGAGPVPFSARRETGDYFLNR